MKTQADVGIGPFSYENCSVFKKGEGGPEAPGALRLRNKKATASVASSYSQNPPVRTWKFSRRRRFEPRGAIFLRKAKAIWSRYEPLFKKSQRRFRARPVLEGGKDRFAKRPQRRPV